MVGSRVNWLRLRAHYFLGIDAIICKGMLRAWAHLKQMTEKKKARQIRPSHQLPPALPDWGGFPLATQEVRRWTENFQKGL